MKTWTWEGDTATFKNEVLDLRISDDGKTTAAYWAKGSKRARHYLAAANLPDMRDEATQWAESL